MSTFFKYYYFLTADRKTQAPAARIASADRTPEDTGKTGMHLLSMLHKIFIGVYP